MSRDQASWSSWSSSAEYGCEYRYRLKGAPENEEYEYDYRPFDYVMPSLQVSHEQDNPPDESGDYSHSYSGRSTHLIDDPLGGAVSFQSMQDNGIPSTMPSAATDNKDVVWEPEAVAAIKSARTENEHGTWEPQVIVWDTRENGKYVNASAKLDTGNDGRNLVTTKIMKAVHAIPDNSGHTIYGVGNVPQRIGGSFWLKFSGRKSPHIVHEEIFHHIADIGSYDILFNKDFVNKLNGDIKPPVLPVRGHGSSRKSKDQQRVDKKKQNEAFRNAERDAQIHNAARQEEIRHREAERQSGSSSSHSNNNYGGSYYDPSSGRYYDNV